MQKEGFSSLFRYVYTLNLDFCAPTWKTEDQKGLATAVQPQSCLAVCAPWSAALQAPLPSISRVCSGLCPLSWGYHPTISSSVILFSCPQSFPASGSFPMSQLFASDGQSIERNVLGELMESLGLTCEKDCGFKVHVLRQGNSCEAK